MKRRNFFKTLAAVVGAAVVVPEAIRGLSEPEPIVGFGTDNDWVKGSTGWTIQKNPDGYYHDFFTVTRLEGFPAHSMVVWLKKGSSELRGNYFFINDTVLVYDPNLDQDSLFVVIGPIDLVVSPLAGKEIRLSLMPISQDQYPISIRPGNMVVRAYNLCLQT